jgi:hypothetical protein
MGAQASVTSQPHQLVRAPATFTLYFRLSVTNVAATLVSLLTNGALPIIPVPNVSGPAGQRFAIKGVWLQSETALGTAQIRYTADGQTVPTATLGMPVNDPSHSNPTQIYCDPEDIQLIGSVAGPTFVQCYLVIQSTTT